MVAGLRMGTVRPLEAKVVEKNQRTREVNMEDKEKEELLKLLLDAYDYIEEIQSDFYITDNGILDDLRKPLEEADLA